MSTNSWRAFINGHVFYNFQSEYIIFTMKLWSFLFINLIIGTEGTQVLDSRSFSAEKNFEIFIKKSKIKSAKTEFILNGFRSILSIWPTKEYEQNEVVIPYKIDTALPSQWRGTINRVIDRLNTGTFEWFLSQKTVFYRDFQNWQG